MKKSLAAKILPRIVQDDIKRTIHPHLTVRASGKGVCSTKTAKDRMTHILASIACLWELGFRIQKLESLCPKHIVALMTYWEKEGKSPEFLHNRLSVLRTLAGWLRKPNIVGDISDYFPKERTERKTATTEDRSWEGKGVDVLKLIEFAKTIDERLSVMLALQHVFGMRVKESIEFRPANAVVEGGTAIEIYEGTKGGKLRRIPVTTNAERETLEWARKVAATGKTRRVRWPDCTWIKAQGRFYGLLNRHLLVTKDQLGITAHGLRHGYHHRQYRIKTGGFASPVETANMDKMGAQLTIPSFARKGRSVTSSPKPPAGLTHEMHLQACLEIMRAMGHERTDIQTAYGGTYGHGFRRISVISVPPPLSVKVTYE